MTVESLIREKLTMIWYQLHYLWRHSGDVCAVSVQVWRSHASTPIREQRPGLGTNRNILTQAECGKSFQSVTNFHMWLVMSPCHLMTFQLFVLTVRPSVGKGPSLSVLHSEQSCEHWLTDWLTANKSINQPKSGKVCLVMSSDWSRRCSHHRVVRSKSFESWKTGFKLARRDFYQSQTQYLIFDCGKERGVICVLHKISNFGGGN